MDGLNQIELLMGALRTESDSAFVDLVRRHSRDLRRFCRRYARDDEECADLQQEVWAKAWEKRLQFEGRGSFAGWLFSLARTACLHHLEHDRAPVKDADLDSFEAPAEADPITATELQDLEDDLLSLVMALPPRRRSVVIARIRVGMSTREAAQWLKCTEGTVKATLHQAIGSLRSSALASGMTKERFGR